MTQLTNQALQSVYGDLLTTTNGGQGLSPVLQQLQDGFGNASTITIATNSINFNRQGGNTFRLDNIPITAAAVDINSVCSPNPIALGTGAITVPRGTTAQRPGVPVNGMIRYNTDVSEMEIFVNNVWGALDYTDD